MQIILSMIPMFSFVTVVIVGCGKTSSGLALAKDRYVIWLEVPPGISVKSACMMSIDQWNSSIPFQSVTQVYNATHVEIVARLIMLTNLLRHYGKQVFTPLHWLLYLRSSEANHHINDLREKLQLSVSEVHQVLFTSTIIGKILQEVFPEEASDPSYPFVLVDELQLLASYTPISNVDPSDPLKRLSVMKLFVEAVQTTSLAAFWCSSSSVVVPIGDIRASNIAKLFTNQREFKIMGKFEYITREQVKHYLETIFVISEDITRSAFFNYLCYMLQGRARVLTAFVEYLLIPDNMIKSHHALSNEALDEAFKEFKTQYIEQKIWTEITALSRLANSDICLDHESQGLLWCYSMFEHFDAAKVGQQYPMERFNSLAFTNSIEKVISYGKETYRFTYTFGEPLLQQALLATVIHNPRIATKGIHAFLNASVSAVTTGVNLDFVVAFSLLIKYYCRGGGNDSDVDQSLLSILCRGTRWEKEYSHYELNISHIVGTSSVQDQEEWFRKLMTNPEDNTFSLLPGVPVKSILVLPSTLSGADVILVAMKKEITDAYSGDDANASFLIVQFCCASYSKNVTMKKHNDQLSKSNEQFEHLKQPSQYAKKYMKLATENAHRIEYLPVLVEIPGNNNIEEGHDFILLTEKSEKAQWLFGIDVIATLTKKASK